MPRVKKVLIFAENSPEYIFGIYAILWINAIVVPNLEKVRQITEKTIDECIRYEIDRYNENIVSYKRLIKFHISSQELPKTRLGKVQRFKLPSFIVNEKKDVIKDDISNKSKTYLSLKKFIDEETGQYANGDDHFEIDLALDSMGRISLISYISENFNLNIDEKLIMECFTLNKLSNYIEANTSKVADNNVSWGQFFRESKQNLKLPYLGVLHIITYSIIKIIGRIFYIITKKGGENLPKEENCIYVANHRSSLDPAFLMTILSWKKGRDIYFFAKDKHFKGRFRQFLAKRHNIIIMNINSNIKDSLLQMYQVLKKGKSLIIFPEGTRSKGGDLKEFKESFAILSKEAQVPVVPIAIQGAEFARYKCVRIPKYLTKIGVNILPSMTIKSVETTKEFASRVRKAISEKL